MFKCVNEFNPLFGIQERKTYLHTIFSPDHTPDNILPKKTTNNR